MAIPSSFVHDRDLPTIVRPPPSEPDDRPHLVTRPPLPPPPPAVPLPAPVPVVIPVTVPPSFDEAPQRASVIASVRSGIININQIIDILSRPITTGGDIIDMDYAPEDVKRFKTIAEECQSNFTMASGTATAWFTTVGDFLQKVTNDLAGIHDNLTSTAEKIASNNSQIQTNISAIATSTANLTHERQLVDEAQGRANNAQHKLDVAKNQQNTIQMVRKGLIWIPVAVAVLTVADMAVLENNVKSARNKVKVETAELAKDNQLLQDQMQQLQQLRQEGANLNALSTSFQTSESLFRGQQAQLNQESSYLGPLKVNIDQCVHTVSGALGSATNIDNMMSMRNVGDGIRGVAAALKSDADFSGVLATLDDQGFAELDQKIVAMQKASKRLSQLGV